MDGNPTWRAGAAATLVALGVAAAVVGAVQQLRKRSIVTSVVARKVMHTATGLVYMAVWPLFKSAPYARCWAAAVPAIITVKFFAVGSCIMKDPQLVASATRHGNPQELLAGPFLYGIVHTAATLITFTSSPAAVVALSALCAGDGLADVAGRRFGRLKPLGKLPWSPGKTWAGSIACLLGSWAASLLMILNLRAFGVPLGVPHLAAADLAARCLACATAAALVESLPVREVDNVTVPLVAGLVSWAVFGGTGSS